LSIENNGRGITLRYPTAEDGYAIYDLVRRSPPLDVNSIYCYHLLSRHFNKTCVVAEDAGRIVGFLSAYPVPERPETLFVWQVAVDADCRGQGIARQMLDGLLGRPECEGMRAIETTVGPSNKPSRSLFHSYAKRRGVTIDERLFLPASAFGEGEHESEMLLRIPLAKQPEHQGDN
jgi:L-2,4-diaminobutyric acid acetyltransferase